MRGVTAQAVSRAVFTEQKLFFFPPLNSCINVFSLRRVWLAEGFTYFPASVQPRTDGKGAACSLCFQAVFVFTWKLLQSLRDSKKLFPEMLTCLLWCVLRAAKNQRGFVPLIPRCYQLDETWTLMSPRSLRRLWDVICGGWWQLLPTQSGGTKNGMEFKRF